MTARTAVLLAWTLAMTGLALLAWVKTGRAWAAAFVIGSNIALAWWLGLLS